MALRNNYNFVYKTHTHTLKDIYFLLFILDGWYGVVTTTCSLSESWDQILGYFLWNYACDSDKNANKRKMEGEWEKEMLGRRTRKKRNRLMPPDLSYIANLTDVPSNSPQTPDTHRWSNSPMVWGLATPTPSSHSE